MTDPVYALIVTALVLALIAAMVIPAPARAADNEVGVQLALLGGGCVATIVMGVLALLEQPAESTISGAIAWLLVMPCIWLNRVPRPADGCGEQDEDEDDGGSPAPRRPSDQPAADDRLPGLQPPALPAARAAGWSAPQPTPVMATAAKVRRMLAELEATKPIAVAAASSLPQSDRQDIAADPLPITRPAPTALHTTRPQLHPTSRLRADHRSIAHVLAAAAHARTRRHATATAPRHAARSDSRSAVRD